MMLETAKTLGQLDIQSIKIHLLHVLKGTVLAQMYERGGSEHLKWTSMSISSATSWNFCLRR